MKHRALVVCALLVACAAPSATNPSDTGTAAETSAANDSSSTAPAPTTGPSVETSTSTTDPSDTTSAGGEGPKLDVGVLPDLPSGDETGIEFDCDNIPDLPVEATLVRTLQGAEDLAFDAFGNLVIAVRGTNAVFLYPREGEPVLLNPDIDLLSTAGTSILPDGDIVVADEALPVIARIHPEDGQVTHINFAASGGCNGLTVGNDGMMYGASYNAGALRIDPDTGETEVLYDGTYGIDGITFSPAQDYLYFNEGELYQQGEGRLFRAELEDGMVGEVVDLGPPLAGTQGTIDGMTTDVCGNVYIATQNVNNVECAGSSVVRVNLDDEAEIVACLGNMAFTPSLSFGSGVGDWERDVLYVIDWAGKLHEVPVGVPGRPLPHL